MCTSYLGAHHDNKLHKQFTTKHISCQLALITYKSHYTLIYKYIMHCTSHIIHALYVIHITHYTCTIYNIQHTIYSYTACVKLRHALSLESSANV